MTSTISTIDADPPRLSSRVMSARADDDVLREVMDGLEMPRQGLRKWFAHDRKFCNAHGGQRVYAELLELFEECDRVLDAVERDGK
jgi:hypothetical protein